jgi:hypothetical protein
LIGSGELYERITALTVTAGITYPMIIREAKRIAGVRTESLESLIVVLLELLRVYCIFCDLKAFILFLECRLCFALCMWNKRDPILKERLFGLTGPEGNHGEDCKEEYFYLRSTPTHSYVKGLYKYPINAYPYELLAKENQMRTRHDREYELVLLLLSFCCVFLFVLLR